MKVVLCVIALFGAALAAPGGRIVGGGPASRGDAPTKVSLQWCLLGLCQHSCGGTIISPDWILTAAHCITELPNIGNINVLAGVLNLDDNNIERQYVSTSQRIVHPDYQGGVNPHDIALIRLSSSLVLNSQVQVARLPEVGEEPSGTALLVGWGSVGGIILPQMPNTLQRANLPIISIDVCDSALTDILNGGAHPLDLDSNVCTGPLDAPISACNGDSGGPLFLEDDKVVGVVSWGINPCGTVGAPTVFVKVSHYIQWIRSYID